MVAFWIADLLNHQNWLSSPFALVIAAFQIWMLVDAIRREEWLWVVFIVLFPVINAVLYYVLIYRNAPSLGTARFEFPGTAQRRRIQELQAQIHHLDKAHHHAALGTIYLQQKKFEDAEKCFRNAMERDRDDRDTQASLGETLLRLGKPAEAIQWLEPVCLANPKHNYGYSLMALAEAYAALGQQDKAFQAWQHISENYSYARARVELAELHLARGETAPAKAKLQEAVADDAHAPAFERRHERFWIKRAKKLLAGLN
ncbi:MAG: tetratricopeptide repeat protein [Verrucomicrobiota bacterium]